jgi:hypothetical protein
MQEAAGLTEINVAFSGRTYGMHHAATLEDKPAIQPLSTFLHTTPKARPA